MWSNCLPSQFLNACAVFLVFLPSPDSTDTPSPIVSNGLKAPHRPQEVDTLTIVTASAGSTLGALVVLLSVLICLKRLARRRRIRRHPSRSRNYSDDDRIAFIATYTSDVHFILPSYDEAMSQVERSPPPFDLVMSQGARRLTNNNDVTNNETVLDSARETAAGIDNPSARIDSPSLEHTSDSERQINIVSNPLADGTNGEAVHSQNEGAAGQNEEDTSYTVVAGLPRSDSCRSDLDSDSGANGSRPLIREAARGVMV